MFDSRLSHSRRPLVNNCDRHLNSSYDSYNPDDFCKRCQFQLTYDDKIKKSFCTKCAYNLTNDDIATLKADVPANSKSSGSSSADGDKPMKLGGKTDKSAEVSGED